MIKKALIAVTLSVAAYFLLPTCTAHAEESKKIKAVSISTEYTPHIGIICPDELKLKTKNNDCVLYYKLDKDPSDIAIGEYLNFDIKMEAKNGYDFTWLKEVSCKVENGSCSNLKIDKDGKKISFTATITPLSMELAAPKNLLLNNETYTLRWDTVQHASSYEVRVLRIEENGGISVVGKIPSPACSCNLKDLILKKQGFYTVDVTAIPHKKDTYLRKSEKSMLPYDKAVEVTDQETGITSGFWNGEAALATQRYYPQKQGIGVNKEYLKDGVYKIEGAFRMFDHEGHLLFGWQQMNGNTYLLDSNGIAKTGWYRDLEKTYYFHPETAAMAVGISQIDNKIYCFDKDGIMQTGWVKQGDDIYYFKNDGTAETRKIVSSSGKTYEFHEDGRLKK